ncbi:MAG: tyrosine--tRNA ligase, partial [Bacteroidales bacterium]|nr:tyrosine--tRNA ligase [Bacteroidales bacterium]
DPAKTSPYAFYQFWMNCSDDDAAKYIKIFTLLSKEEIEALIKRHEAEPHLRELQRTLAREITTMVHSKEDLEMAEEATQILFGKGTSEALHKFDEATLLSIFDGVPQAKLSRTYLEAGMPIVDFLALTEVFSSKGEARKMLQGNGVSINKEKVGETDVVTKECLLNDKYILVQKGKKNYYLVIAE